jgi:DNA-binding NtrC family response regulator
MKRILVVEDEAIQLDLIADRLGIEFSNITIDKVSSFDKIKTLLDEHQYDVVVTDLMEGLENRKDLIKEIMDHNQDSVFIVYTVAPESFPNEYVDHKRTFILNKLQPFEDGMLETVKQALNFDTAISQH